MNSWYDIATPTLNQDDKSIAAGALWALRGDAGQRVITAWHFGQSPARKTSGTDWMIPLITELMKDPYAAVRWVAYDALRKDEALKEIVYDFDAPESSRNQRVEQILAESLGKLTPNQIDPSIRARLLQANDGMPDLERMNELLKRRDRRMVAGVE